MACPVPESAAASQYQAQLQQYHLEVQQNPNPQQPTMDDGSVSSDSSSLGTQLKNSAHNGDVAATEQLLMRMEQDGSDLTVETYNYVIHACATAHNVERAEYHVNRMESKGFEPNLVTFNSMVNACATIGDAARAETWLRRMVERGVPPSQVTYGTLCKVFARQGQVSQVRAVMDMVERSGMALNEYFYASLIAACRVSTPPNVQEAVRAFEDLVAHGLRPQSVKRALERVVGQRRTAQLFATVGTTSASAPAAPASPKKEVQPTNKSCPAVRSPPGIHAQRRAAKRNPAAAAATGMGAGAGITPPPGLEGFALAAPAPRGGLADGSAMKEAAAKQPRPAQQHQQRAQHGAGPAALQAVGITAPPGLEGRTVHLGLEGLASVAASPLRQQKQQQQLQQLQQQQQQRPHMSHNSLGNWDDGKNIAPLPVPGVIGKAPLAPPLPTKLLSRPHLQGGSLGGGHSAPQDYMGFATSQDLMGPSAAAHRAAGGRTVLCF